MSLILGYVLKKNDGYVKKCGLAIQVMKIGCIKGDVLPLAKTLGQVFWGDKECLFQCKGKTFEHLLFLEQKLFFSLSFWQIVTADILHSFWHSNG